MYRLIIVSNVKFCFFFYCKMLYDYKFYSYYAIRRIRYMYFILLLHIVELRIFGCRSTFCRTTFHDAIVRVFV